MYGITQFVYLQALSSLIKLGYKYREYIRKLSAFVFLHSRGSARGSHAYRRLQLASCSILQSRSPTRAASYLLIGFLASPEKTTAQSCVSFSAHGILHHPLARVVLYSAVAFAGSDCGI